MKKNLSASIILCLIATNAFAYEMTQKDSDAAKQIIQIIEKKWEKNFWKYLNAIEGYKIKHNGNERIQLILQQVISRLNIMMNPLSPNLADPTEIQKSVILQLTTLCENSNTKFQYNYAENIWDWRWITFWIIGFTTWTFDGNMLLHRYAEMNPNNVLKKYISALDAIDKGKHDDGGKNDNISGLENFIKDVNNNSDPLFKKAQLELMNSMYWNPSVKISKEMWVKHTLSRAFIYDMVVNHWEYGALDIIDKTNKAMGGTPKNNTDEIKWLGKLMDYRYEFLKSDYPEALDRVRAFRELMNKWNADLKPDFEFTIYWDTFSVNGNVY